MNSSSNKSTKSFHSVYGDPNETPVAYQRDALAYWQQKCGDRFAPRWSDISLMDFPAHVIPRIIVIDINPETLETKYRFWGTQLTELHGADYTGRSATEILPKIVGDSLEDAYQKLVREKRPHLKTQEFYQMSELRGHQIVLRMPLSDDGVRVTNALIVTYQEMPLTDRPYSEFFSYVLDE